MTRCGNTIARGRGEVAGSQETLEILLRRLRLATWFPLLAICRNALERTSRHGGRGEDELLCGHLLLSKSPIIIILNNDGAGRTDRRGLLSKTLTLRWKVGKSKKKETIEKQRSRHRRHYFADRRLTSFIFRIYFYWIVYLQVLYNDMVALLRVSTEDW